jgi:hypothetical protein
LTLPVETHSFSWEKQHAVAVFLAPASDGRRSEATFAGIETGTALMLMPMVLAQLPALASRPKIFSAATLADGAIRFVDALFDGGGGALCPASARVATLRDSMRNYERAYP